MLQNSSKKTATAWAIICAGCVASSEGLVTSTYRDINGVPTICYGETKNITIGMHKTPAECKGALIERLDEFGAGVDKCTTVTLPPKRKAGIVSFAYNVGISRYCHSSVNKDLNAGRTVVGCNDLLKYDRAGGIIITGLHNRRVRERELCLAED